jgi:SAM-dependent methyltransferase
MLWGCVPDVLRRALGVDDSSAVGSRRIEIGPGPYPTPGFIHIDIWPWGPHLEAIGPMWDLPFPDNWATDIRAIHALEHVHPSQLEDTLDEWRRVLTPGGKVLVSVPNGPAIMEAFTRSPVPEKWPLAGSILGMYCTPGLRNPRELISRSDHQILFDWEVLRWALETAGFRDVTDLSDDWKDRHSEAWDSVVKSYSLVAQATAA